MYSKVLLIFFLIFLFSCSSSYEKLSITSFNPPNEFSKHLLEAYKDKADFEAKEMHDWNSTKLYSEKALKAANGEEILPQHISYWKIPSDGLPENISEKRLGLIKAYNNLMIIYDEALLLDPFNLAKAISSLDCWAEQQEENWQTWDIDRCRDDYLDSMHALYNVISENENKLEKSDKKIIDTSNSNDSATLVTEDKFTNLLQIVYFDFDKSKLTSVSMNEIKNFILKNKENINKYLLVGHTDTAGTKEYNFKLSIERAESVKKILLDLGIESQKIKIIGKGENDLLIKTDDNIPHPANRRAEISPLN